VQRARWPPALRDQEYKRGDARRKAAPRLETRVASVLQFSPAAPALQGNPSGPSLYKAAQPSLASFLSSMLQSFKLVNYVGYSATRMCTNRNGARTRRQKSRQCRQSIQTRIGKACEDLELNPSRRRVSSKRSKRLQDRQETTLLERRFRT
jgi:hypothetical protein